MFFLETNFPKLRPRACNSQSYNQTADRAHVVRSVCVALKDLIGNGDRPRDNPLGRVDCGATEARAV